MSARKLGLVLLGALMCAVLFWPPAETEVPVIKLAGSFPPPEQDQELSSAPENSSSNAETSDDETEGREAADIPIHHVGVQVLDHDNWAAVAHTQVFYITDAIRQQDPKLNDFRSKDGWQRLQDLPSVTTDSDGMAVLELPGRIAYLYCRSDSAKGMLKVKLGSEPITEVNYRNVIYLHRESTVEAKVLRHDGRPAVGVPVVVEGTLKPVGITDENGLATLEMPLSILNDIRDQKGVDGQLTLRCKLPLLDDPTAVISEIGGAWHAEVQLPAYGGIEVVNLEPDWSYTINDDNYNSLSLTAQEADGELSACEDFIPVGASLTLVQSLGGSAIWDEQEMESEIAVPTMDGEVVRVVAQKAIGVRFRGRLLDSAGEPVQSSGFSVWYLDEEGDGTFAYSMATTDESGEFSLFKLEPGSWLNQTKYLWIINNPDNFSNPRSKPASFRAENIGWGTTNEIDLGDLRPLEMEFLLSGKAVDSDGLPVKDVVATISRDLPQTGEMEELRYTVDEIAAANLGNAAKGEFLFEYAATPFPCEYELNIYSEENEERNVSFQPGTKDLVVVLRQSLNVPFGYFGYPLARSVKFELISADGSRYQASDRYHPQTEASDITTDSEFLDIPVGSYAFQALAENGTVLVEIAGVNVQKGATNPSLKNIDLTSQDVIQLSLKFPPQYYSKYTIRDQFVVYAPEAGGYVRTDHVATKPGGMVLPLEYTHDDYMLVLAGCKPVNLRGRQDGDVIKVEGYPAIPVEIPDVERLFDMADCWVRLESANPGDNIAMQLLNGADLQINEDEERLEFALPGPGTYIPVWEILEEDYSSGRLNSTFEFRGPPIHLDPERDSSGITLTVPAEFRAKLMEGLTEEK